MADEPASDKQTSFFGYGFGASPIDTSKQFKAILKAEAVIKKDGDYLDRAASLPDGKLFAEYRDKIREIKYKYEMGRPVSEILGEINKWVNTIKYDYSTDPVTHKGKPQNPYAVLKHGTAICSGLAELKIDMAERVGLDRSKFSIVNVSTFDPQADSGAKLDERVERLESPKIPGGGMWVDRHSVVLYQDEKSAHILDIGSQKNKLGGRISAFATAKDYFEHGSTVPYETINAQTGERTPIAAFSRTDKNPDIPYIYALNKDNKAFPNLAGHAPTNQELPPAARKPVIVPPP